MIDFIALLSFCFVLKSPYINITMIENLFLNLIFGHIIRLTLSRRRLLFLYINIYCANQEKETAKSEK